MQNLLIICGWLPLLNKVSIAFLPLVSLTLTTSFFFTDICDSCRRIAPNNSSLTCGCVIRLLLDDILTLIVISIG